MKNKKTIQIVSEKFLEDFEDKINELLAEGWVPHYASFHTSGDWHYIALHKTWKYEGVIK